MVNKSIIKNKRNEPLPEPKRLVSFIVDKIAILRGNSISLANYQIAELSNYSIYICRLT
jgi:hypothetical protein